MVGKLCVIGNKGSLCLRLFDDGMTAGDDVNGIAFIELRTTVIVPRRDFRQAQVSIDLCQRVSGVENGL